MKKYKSLDEIRTDLDKGIEIFWSNESYHLHYVEAREHSTPFSVKDGKAIRVTCKSNYFGSLIEANEIPVCFSKGGVK